MKKRIISILLAAALTVLCGVSALAKEPEPRLAVDGKEYSFREGQKMIFSENHNRVLVPVNVAEEVLRLGLGSSVVDMATQRVSLVSKGKSVSFRVGESFAVIREGSATSYMAMDCAPEQHMDVIYLPLRYAAVAFGCRVDWNKGAWRAELSTAPQSGPEVNLYFTRHGKTVFNTQGRVQGWCDSPLTEEGITVASYLGKGLLASGIRFTAAYSGDLGRQRETARLVLENMGQGDLPVQELFALRESSFGSWEGELESERDQLICSLAGVGSIFDLYRAGSGQFSELVCRTDTTGTAETQAAQQTRIMGALTEIAKTAEAAGGGNVLVVSSGGIGAAMVQLFNGTGAELKNASVTRLSYQGGVFVLHSISDMSFVELGADLG